MLKTRWTLKVGTQPFGGAILMGKRDPKVGDRLYLVEGTPNRLHWSRGAGKKDTVIVDQVNDTQHYLFVSYV